MNYKLKFPYNLLGQLEIEEEMLWNPEKTQFSIKEYLTFKPSLLMRLIQRFNNGN